MGSVVCLPIMAVDALVLGNHAVTATPQQGNGNNIIDARYDNRPAPSSIPSTAVSL
jgi:hypothetical protein